MLWPHNDIKAQESCRPRVENDTGIRLEALKLTGVGGASSEYYGFSDKLNYHNCLPGEDLLGCAGTVCLLV